MGYLTEFSQKIAGIIRAEWRQIPDPGGEEWDKQFEAAVGQYLSSRSSNCVYGGVQEKKDACTDEHLSVRDLSQEEELQLAVKAMGILEGIWLEGRRKIDAIEQSEKNHALLLDDVVNYARRLRGTTYSPPENMNVHDPTRHYEMFPHFHFLGAPTIGEMHNSRLFALSKMAQHSSAPRILFEPVSEDMQRMRLDCSTPGAVIHYQTSRVNMQQINPHTGQPTVYTTAPSVYDSTKKFNFKVKSARFIVYAWSTCEGLLNSEISVAEYNPPSADGATPAKKNFSLFLGKEREQS